MKTLIKLSPIIFLLCLSCSANNKTSSKQAYVKNVIVVINKNSPDSKEVGQYYAVKRNIPKSHICVIDCPLDEVIEHKEFESKIKTPLRGFVEKLGRNKIDYIVLTKGIPIKTRSKVSVDSALVALFEDYTSYKQNPYYAADQPFSSKEYGIYLVTRLDGLSIKDAKALVDRSIAAKPSDGLYLFDMDPDRDKSPGYKFVNDGMREAAKILRSRKIDVELDDSQDFIIRKNLMGYYSWGSNDNKYTYAEFKKLRFLPGSIAELAVSVSAFTLKPVIDPNKKIPTYIVYLIQQGATGVKGYVYEPYTPALAVADILFERYTKGRNLAESFYAASRFIYWQDLIVGDPLCAPYKK